ncbi:MAG: SHOCT domain-containing protein [Dermatophilaceae bacterium]
MTAARSDLVWVWPVVLLLGVAALFWALMLLRRAGDGESARRRPGEGDDTARAILAERFARGQIGEVEYLQRRRVLDER